MAQVSTEKIQQAAKTASGISQIVAGDKPVQVQHSVDKSVTNTIIGLLVGIAVIALIIKLA